MDSVHIRGGKPLLGEVITQGSKNGALPLLTATVLIKGKTVLHNCPKISDIDAMLDLLRGVGCTVTVGKKTIVIDAGNISTTECPAKQVRAMRSSIMLLGPMLGRCGQVCMNRPGGCVIGKRPVDIHEMALSKMNVKFFSDENNIVAETVCLEGADIKLPFPSVGATENIVMAAVTAKGVTHVSNAAREPEIEELCHFLNLAGARIEGVGESELTITGVERLHETEYTVMPDRIVAGTYLLAATATRGQIVVQNAPTGQLTSLLTVLRSMGARITTDEDIICLDADVAINSIPYLKTEVYPGFPTDLQSMLTVTLSLAEGNSCIEETIFEDRFRIVEELVKMGASITIKDNQIHIKGTSMLRGCELYAKELRGGAALIIAGLCAKKETIVHGCEYIERGYEDICRDLRKIDADIKALA